MRFKVHDYSQTPVMLSEVKAAFTAVANIFGYVIPFSNASILRMSDEICKFAASQGIYSRKTGNLTVLGKQLQQLIQALVERGDLSEERLQEALNQVSQSGDWSNCFGMMQCLRLDRFLNP